MKRWLFARRLLKAFASSSVPFLLLSSSTFAEKIHQDVHKFEFAAAFMSAFVDLPLSLLKNIFKFLLDQKNIWNWNTIYLQFNKCSISNNSFVCFLCFSQLHVTSVCHLSVRSPAGWVCSTTGCSYLLTKKGDNILFFHLFLQLFSRQLTEEKWSFFHSSRSHVHRPSCVATEVERLNTLLQKKIGQSILGKVGEKNPCSLLTLIKKIW